MPKTKPLPISGEAFDVRYLTFKQMRALRENGLFAVAAGAAQAEAVRDELLVAALSPDDLSRLEGLAMPDALALAREILRVNYSDPDAEGNS